MLQEVSFSGTPEEDNILKTVPWLTTVCIHVGWRVGAEKIAQGKNKMGTVVPSVEVYKVKDT